MELLEIKNLTKTYDLTRTKFIRSSVLSRGGVAQGAGDIRGLKLNFDTVWQGTGSNVAKAIPLETTQSNSTAYTVTDDGAFTANGFFTLRA